MESFRRGVRRNQSGRMRMAIIAAGLVAIATASALGQTKAAVIRIGLPAALTANGKPSNLLSTDITARYLKEQLGQDAPRIEWIGIALLARASMKPGPAVQSISPTTAIFRQLSVMAVACSSN